MQDDEYGVRRETLEDMRRGVIATVWLRLRAALGSVEAQFVIGRTLMFGSHCQPFPCPDYGRARTWLIRAAGRGHARALFYLEILDELEHSD